MQAGEGDISTVEEAMRVAASIAHDAIVENRAVGLTTSGHRLVSIPADRGPRQRQKIMQLLAAVEGDGQTPLAEVLLTGLPKLRRGMTAVVVTPSRDAMGPGAGGAAEPGRGRGGRDPRRRQLRAVGDRDVAARATSADREPRRSSERCASPWPNTT